MNKEKVKLSVALILLVLFVHNFTWAQSAHVTVDLQKKVGELKPIWSWFGYDEPNYTYMKDGKKLLTELSELSYTPVYVRAHNLLTTGDGTPALKWGSTNAYTEDQDGNPIYDWTIVDRIFDTYIERGMKPLVEIGFMPQALSTKPEPYQHHWVPGDPYDKIFTGWAYPPTDYDKWRELIYQWVRHSIDRYGETEVNSWYWEVWNEPDYYFKGTFEEYCKLYDYAADGLKRALPTARIGGPHTTDPANKHANEYLRKFLEHCVRGTNYATGKVGSPLDFIAFHAKGFPVVVDGVVRMDLGRHIRNITAGFEMVASFPEIKHLPIIIGESDPEGCAACSVELSPQNAYRNGTMYSSYTAATFPRIYELASLYGVRIEGVVSWSFVFEDQPWFAGFRELATNGVDKPVLNVFRMYGMMRGDLLEVTSSTMPDAKSIAQNSVRDHADIGAFASCSENSSAIMVWNYHDDHLTDVSPAEIILQVEGIKTPQVFVSHYRIDEDHSNSYSVWKAMGSPRQPTVDQIKELERSGQLQLFTSPRWMNVKEGTLELSMELPRQGVSLIKIDW